MRVSPIGLKRNWNSPGVGPDVRNVSHAVTVEQGFDDVGLDVGLGPEDHGEAGVGHAGDSCGSERRRRLDLHQDHCHIVVLIGATGKCAQLGQDVRAQLIERQVRVLLDHLREALLAEAVERLVHRFGNAVGEPDDQVARRDRDRLLLQDRLEHRPVVDLQADDEAVGHEQPGLAHAGRLVRRDVDQRAVPGARERHLAPLDVDHAVRSS